MNKIIWLVFSAILLASLIGCGDQYRKPAQGAMSEVLIVMDSTQWNSETAQALRETFGGEIFTLPRPEQRYDLRFQSLRTTSDLERARRHTSVIFAAPVTEDSHVGGFIRASLSDDILERIADGRNFMFPLRNRWYNNQWTLFLSARSDEELALKIRNNEHTLLNSLNNVEIQRWQNQIYRRGEQVALADTLWEKHGFRIRVQHDYRVGIDTTGFVSLRRFLPDNDRWIYFWYEDGVTNTDHVTSEWINATRDSLMEEHIRGSRDGSYVQTEYRRPVETRKMVLNGYEAYETRGTWQMINDLMGGPFVHYTIYDPELERLYMMEFAQFAPRYSKRRFVYQFEAMAHTFQSDSTFTPQERNNADDVTAFIETKE